MVESALHSYSLQRFLSINVIIIIFLASFRAKNNSHHLLTLHHVPGTLRSAVQTLSHSTLFSQETPLSQGFRVHFTDEDPEA